jgi:hypothetical protein
MTDAERISGLEARVAELEQLFAKHWPKKMKARPTAQEMADYCVTLKLPASDGELVHAKWEGTGWTNGGFPIKDWKGTIRSWKLHGYMPSQRNLILSNGNTHNTRPSGGRNQPGRYSSETR